MPASASATVGASYNHGWNRSTAKALGKTAQKTITKGLAKTVGKSTGRTVGTAVANTLGRAVTSSMAATRGVSKAVSFGGNVGANFARSSTTTAMLGKNEGITQNYTNFNVQHALELLKEQMKRFEQSTALGMWDFAAYVLSEDPNVASNLLGKSVEMLSNAIAEMRTYGEGFIIADQAPGLMDMSVIRNTNTKIILRLPDQADRELVGRAANLNEDQITELAKVPCGVAAVYQNEWIQPVLCKVDLFAAPEKPFMFDPDDNDLDNYCKTEVEESLLNCIMEKEILRRGNKTDLKALKSKIIKSKLETCVKRDFMEYLEHDGENAIETLRKLIYDFLSAENAIIEAKQCNDIVEWTRTVVDRLNPSLRAYPNKQIDLALALILYEQTLRDASYGSVFCKFTEVYKNEGGVF